MKNYRWDCQVSRSKSIMLRVFKKEFEDVPWHFTMEAALMHDWTLSPFRMEMSLVPLQICHRAGPTQGLQ